MASPGSLSSSCSSLSGSQLPRIKTMHLPPPRGMSPTQMMVLLMERRVAQGSGAGGGGSSAGGGSSEVKLEELSKYFHLPEKSVAKELGICLTSLKKLCRSYGITRWPFRKLKSLERTMKKVQTEEQAVSSQAAGGGEGGVDVRRKPYTVGNKTVRFAPADGTPILTGPLIQANLEQDLTIQAGHKTPRF